MARAGSTGRVGRRHSNRQPGKEVCGWDGDPAMLGSGTAPWADPAHLQKQGPGQGERGKEGEGEGEGKRGRGRGRGRGRRLMTLPLLPQVTVFWIQK